MTKIIYGIILLHFLACGKSGPNPGSDSATDSNPITNPGSSSGCGTYNGKSLFKGSDGGCYYINSNGNKTYVSRSLCRC
jgi:hypothetical protein